MGARTQDESDGSGLVEQRGKGGETIDDRQIACRIRQQNAKPAVVYAILKRDGIALDCSRQEFLIPAGMSVLSAGNNPTRTILIGYVQRQCGLPIMKLCLHLRFTPDTEDYEFK